MSTPYESLSYLFDDIEKEMDNIFLYDTVLRNHQEAIEKHHATAEKCALEEDGLRQQMTTFDLRISELEAELKDLDRERRIILGKITGNKGTIRYMNRLVAAREVSINRRKKDLLMMEGKKRLALIGRKIKHNVARRGGGGLDIVDADAPAKRPMAAEDVARIRQEQQPLE